MGSGARELKAIEEGNFMQVIRSGRCWQFEIIFEPRDIWIGVYWKKYPEAIELYICVIPMLPLRLYCQWQPDWCGEIGGRCPK